MTSRTDTLYAAAMNEIMGNTENIIYVDDIDWQKTVDAIRETSAQTPKQSILDEADRATSMDRNQDYGHPRENIANTAELWNDYFARRFQGKSEFKIDGRDVAMCMVLVKVSRDANRRKRDNLVDLAGWARVAEMLEE